MNWKLLRVAAATAVMLATIGCGGVNGSYNVSPASFFIPGMGLVTTNSPSQTLAVASPTVR